MHHLLPPALCARGSYEAYAIYSFYKLMESYLEGEGVIPGKMLERVGQHCHHMFPFKVCVCV
jgi:hypothetical protein